MSFSAEKWCTCRRHWTGLIHKCTQLSQYCLISQLTSLLSLDQMKQCGGRPRCRISSRCPLTEDAANSPSNEKEEREREREFQLRRELEIKKKNKSKLEAETAIKMRQLEIQSSNSSLVDGQPSPLSTTFGVSKNVAMVPIFQESEVELYFGLAVALQ